MDFYTPKTFRDTKDMLLSVLVGAPKFELLQSAVKVPLTMEMVFESLLKAMEGLSRRTQKAEAKELFEKAMSEVSTALQLYKQGCEAEGKRAMWSAQQTFTAAGKAARGKLPSKLWVEKD